MRRLRRPAVVVLASLFVSGAAGCGAASPGPAGSQAASPAVSRCPAAGAKLDKCHLAEAMTSVDPRACASPNGPKALGQVRVTFEPDGHASDVTIDGGLADSSVGDCLKMKFHAVRVPPFEGPKVVGSRTVDLR